MSCSSSNGGSTTDAGTAADSASDVTTSTDSSSKHDGGTNDGSSSDGSSKKGSPGDTGVTADASDGSVTLDGGSCGSNTAAVVTAANAFLTSLSSTLLATAQISFTEAAAETWTNLPGGNRNGVEYETLSTAQQALALSLAQTALSAAGYSEMQNIRKADDVIASTTTGNSGWGSELTHFAVLGTPSTTTPWMLQICQHHLVYNIVYNGALVSATPVFLGTEPPNFTVLADGTTLVTGLVSGSTVTFVNGQQGTAPTDAGTGTAYAAVDPQRAAADALTTAILADSSVASAAKISGTFSDVVYGINTSTGGDSNYPFSTTLGDTLVYPTGTSDRGVLYSSLSTSEQALARAAIEAWVDTQSCDIRTNLLAAYESGTALAQTYVGYGVPSGAAAPSFGAFPNQQADALQYQGSYFRIDGPRVFIEFVVQEAVAFRAQSWVHYHSVWRDKTADYGGEFSSERADASTSTGGGPGGDGGGGGMMMGDGGMGGAPPEGGMGTPP